MNLPGHSSLDLQDEQTDRETETDRQTDRRTDGRTDELQNALHIFLQDTKVCVKENGQLYTVRTTLPETVDYTD